MFLLFKLKSHQDVKYMIGVGLINQLREKGYTISSITSITLDKHEFIEQFNHNH